MKVLTAAILGSGLVMSVVLLSGATVLDPGDTSRHGSYCPNGAECNHQLEHDEPALFDAFVRRAEIAMTRQMTQFERAVMVAAGVPAHATR
jgi:hypothetical protein